MHPANKHFKSKLIAGTAALLLVATVLSVGSAYGRFIEWASTEYIYTPSPATEYSSDCLTQQGQMIQLKDWSADETSRTIAITVLSPTWSPEPPADETTQETTETPTEETTAVPTEATVENAEQQMQTEQEESDTEESTIQTTDTENSGMEDPTTNILDTEESTEREETVSPTTEDPEIDHIVQWTNGEVMVTLDTAAAAHLALSAEVTQTQILVTLTRWNGVPGLAEASQMSFQVLWQGLQGTFTFLMMPYGDIQIPEVIVDDIQRQVVTGLQLFSACDVMDVENPVSILKLNKQTCEDFTLRFSCENQPVYRVRYSMDGGETYTMLYETHQLTIPWPYPEDWSGTVYLDFSQALTAQQRPTINVMATEYTAQEYSPVRQSVPRPGNFVMLVEELPYLMQMSPIWGSARLEKITVERLTVNDEGQLNYAEDSALVATVEDSGIRLSPAKEGMLPTSGSYRLTILWSWHNEKIKEHTVYFFVNTH